MVYDLVGDGSTALKFAANRYVVPVGVQVVGRVNPVSAVSDTGSGWLRAAAVKRPRWDAIATTT